MKISAFEVRIGNLIEYQKKLWRVHKKATLSPEKAAHLYNWK